MKIRTKLLLAMILIGVLPVMLVAGYIHFKLSDFLSHSQGYQLQKEGEIVRQYLVDNMQRQTRELRNLKANPVFSDSLMSDFDYSAVNQLLTGIVADKENSFSFIMLTNSAGITVGASDKRLLGKHNAGKKWHQITLAKGSYLSDWNQRPESAILSKPPYGGDFRYTQVVSQLITGNDGVKLGTINARVKWQLTQGWISREIDSFHKEGWQSKTITVVKGDGKIIAHAQGSAFYGKPLTEIVADPANIKTIKKQKSGIFHDSGHGTPQVCSFATLSFNGNIWKVIVTVSEAEFYKVNNYFLRVLAGACVICLLLAIVMGLLVSKSIINPLDRVVSMLQEISTGDGDLTVHLPTTATDKKSDELDQLARAFNAFVKKLHEIFQEVADSLNSFNASSIELTTMAETLSSGAQVTSERSNGVAAAAEEMSSNMNSVAAAVEEASTNISQVASAAEEMSSSFSKIVEHTGEVRHVTEEAVQQVQDATGEISGLGDAAGEIGQVVETINSISSQTNLLALNATIEAARAGEAGKGFAVVANEIKELAAQTAAATEEIRDRIGGIQGSVNGTVVAIEQISTVINRVNEIVAAVTVNIEEQDVVSGQIADNVGQASIGIMEVAENVAQSSAVSGQVAGDIAEVSQAADEITASGEQVRQNAEELAALASRLQKLVGNFKL